MLIVYIVLKYMISAEVWMDQFKYFYSISSSEYCPRYWIFCFLHFCGRDLASLKKSNCQINEIQESGGLKLILLEFKNFMWHEDPANSTGAHYLVNFSPVLT